MNSPALINRYWSAIETIQCPIFEIRGKESGLVSDGTIEKMKKLGKDVSSVDVSSAGHVVMVDQPEAFIEAIRAFVRL
jgi:pimeloyl-ACP methyl ester carboxylesterase